MPSNQPLLPSAAAVGVANGAAIGLADHFFDEALLDGGLLVRERMTCDGIDVKSDPNVAVSTAAQRVIAGNVAGAVDDDLSKRHVADLLGKLETCGLVANITIARDHDFARIAANDDNFRLGGGGRRPA